MRALDVFLEKIHGRLLWVNLSNYNKTYTHRVLAWKEERKKNGKENEYAIMRDVINYTSKSYLLNEIIRY